MKSNPKIELEAFILDKIGSGEWKTNQKLPVEPELMELAGISKMTVRKIISKLKERNILYSIESKGVFVSPFHEYGIIKKLSNRLGATETKFIHYDLEIPKFFEDRLQLDINLPKGTSLSYLKAYLKDDEVLGYTKNWLNNSFCGFSYNKVFKSEVDVHCNADYEKVISINKMEPIDDLDRKYLSLSTGYIPTTYTYYLGKQRQIILLRVTKILPHLFESLNVQSIQGESEDDPTNE